jgi:hypothetical protein
MPWTLSEIAAGVAFVGTELVIAVALLIALATSFNVLVW